VAPLG